MPKKYVVNVQEVLSKLVIVDADSEEDAENIAEALHRDGKIILECEDFYSVETVTIKEASETDKICIKEVYS